MASNGFKDWPTSKIPPCWGTTKPSPSSCNYAEGGRRRSSAAHKTLFSAMITMGRLALCLPERKLGSSLVGSINTPSPNTGEQRG